MTAGRKWNESDMRGNKDRTGGWLKQRSSPLFSPAPLGHSFPFSLFFQIHHKAPTLLLSPAVCVSVCTSPAHEHITQYLLREMQHAQTLAAALSTAGPPRPPLSSLLFSHPISSCPHHSLTLSLAPWRNSSSQSSFFSSSCCWDSASLWMHHWLHFSFQQPLLYIFHPLSRVRVTFIVYQILKTTSKLPLIFILLQTTDKPFRVIFMCKPFIQFPKPIYHVVLCQSTCIEWLCKPAPNIIVLM